MTESLKDSRIELSVDLRFPEFLRFQVLWFVRRFKWFLGLLLLVGVGYPLHLAYLRASKGIDVQLLHPGLLIPWLMIGVFGASLYFGARKQFGSVWAGQTMRISLGHEGVTAEMPSISSRHAWSKVKSVRETREFVLLSLSEQAVFILPKRCVGDRSKVDSIMSFAKGAIERGRQTV